MKKLFLILLGLTLSLNTLNAQTLGFANAFSDNAILQRDSDVKIWGWDVPDREVTVTCSWTKDTFKAKTDQQGKWMVTVPTLKGGSTEYSVTVRNATQQATINNILFGDVWFCSGQSNMEMRMARDTVWNLDIVGLDEELKKAANSELRYINVPRDERFTTKSETATTGWVEFTPSSIEWVSAVGYFFAQTIQREQGIPVGLFINAYGGSSIQSWIPRKNIDPKEYAPEIDAINKDFMTGADKPYFERVSCLYNALTHPFIDYGIKGWLWYQGETNVADELRYKKQMQDLVSSWREAWGDETLPFYYAQLAPFVYSEWFKFGEWSRFAISQQEIAETIDNCEMVVIADLGIPDNVHPKYKREVGERLATVALANTYGDSTKEWKTATVTKAYVEKGTLTIEFKDTYKGLSFDDKRSELEISYDGIQYEKLQNAKAKGNTVTAKVKGTPTHVRFCWYDNSSANLFNSAGMPVGPFRKEVK